MKKILKADLSYQGMLFLQLFCVLTLPVACPCQNFLGWLLSGRILFFWTFPYPWLYSYPHYKTFLTKLHCLDHYTAFGSHFFCLELLVSMIVLGLLIDFHNRVLRDLYAILYPICIQYLSKSKLNRIYLKL